MAGQQTISMWDYDKETGTVSIPHVEVDAVNEVATTALQDAFAAAVAGVSLGFQFKETRIASIIVTPGTPPNDKNAQRENKWLVMMHDSVTGKKHRMEIPAADLDHLDTQDRGKMDKTLAVYIDLRDAIQALYLTEAGNTVVVDDVIHVGRNL